MKRKIHQVEESSEESQYEVEAIRSRKIVGGVAHYLVKWLGFPQSENSWEPAENLVTIRYMIEDYQQRRKQLLKEKAEKKPEGNSLGSKIKIQGQLEGNKQSAEKNKQKMTPQSKRIDQSGSVNIQSINKKDQKSVKSQKDIAKESSNASLQFKQLATTNQIKGKNSNCSIKTKQPQKIEKKPPEKQAEPLNIVINLVTPTKNNPSKPTIQQQLKDSQQLKINQQNKSDFFCPEISAEKSKPKLIQYATIGVQIPDRLKITRVNHIILKKDQFYYEVEYAKGSQKGIVDVLPSSIVMEQCPELVGQYFERTLRLEQITPPNQIKNH